MTYSEAPPRVVVIGGGFGGLHAARQLAREDVQVTLIDKRNFHLFQPLLYQVATGGLSPADIASPLRYVLRKQRNAEVLLNEVVGIDPARKVVQLKDRELSFDYLVVAAGARVEYFGNDHWQQHAPGLKDFNDARQIRTRVLSAFENAELARSPEEQERWLTFVVVGGGPTGVELAGAVAELARETLPNDFRHVDTRKARILLIEGGSRILPSLSERLSAKAVRSLERLGVEVVHDSMVESLDSESLTIRDGEGTQVLAAGTTLWAAGVSASPLGRTLAEQTGAELDRGGRVIVEQDCSLAAHPNIFVVGDVAHFRDAKGGQLPGTAPVAMQQGRHVARVIGRKLRGLQQPLVFRYHDKGDLATIGRSAAVGRIGKREFSGYPAWLAWLFVHLLYLTEFQNRLLVLIQWAWNYVTWNRSTRLITPPPEPPESAPCADHGAAQERSTNDPVAMS